MSTPRCERCGGQTYEDEVQGATDIVCLQCGGRTLMVKQRDYLGFDRGPLGQFAQGTRHYRRGLTLEEMERIQQ